jgi:hypothetical protein
MQGREGLRRQAASGAQVEYGREEQVLRVHNDFISGGDALIPEIR